MANPDMDALTYVAIDVGRTVRCANTDQRYVLSSMTTMREAMTTPETTLGSLRSFLGLPPGGFYTPTRSTARPSCASEADDVYDAYTLQEPLSDACAVGSLPRSGGITYTLFVVTSTQL